MCYFNHKGSSWAQGWTFDLMHEMMRGIWNKDKQQQSNSIWPRSLRIHYMETYSLVLSEEHSASPVVYMQDANGIHGFQIHSSSCMCVCQVKCTINYKWCIQKLWGHWHISLPPIPTSHCVVKLYPWHVFCISHYKIALAETQERLKCSGEANQAASERQQSKRDFKQLPLLWVKNNNKESAAWKPV